MKIGPIAWRRLFFLLVPVFATPFYLPPPSILKTLILIVLGIIFLVGFFIKDNPNKRPANWRKRFFYFIPFVVISLYDLLPTIWLVVLIVLVALVYLWGFLGSRWFTTYVIVKKYKDNIDGFPDKKNGVILYHNYEI